MNIHAANYDLKTIDVAISYKDRKEGSYSKLNTFKDGFKVIKSYLKCYGYINQYYFIIH